MMEKSAALLTSTLKRQYAIWGLSGIIGLLFFYSAIQKFVWSAQGAMSAGAQKYDAYGLAGRLPLIGIGELISITLFLIPRTASFGVLVLSAHIGGAIATHMEHGESFTFQSIVLILVWLTHWLRNPKMFTHA